MNSDAHSESVAAVTTAGLHTDSRASGPSVLRAEGLEVGYAGRALLPPIQFDIHTGEIWALVGRNGSGKSTLMRTLLNLQPRISGQLVRKPDLRLSYVPQRGDYDLSVPTRVIDFVRAGLDRGFAFLKPGLYRAHHDRIDQALSDTGTSELLRQSMAELSEGQKQRVMVARALVGQPDLMVLDEPTSAMDPMGERAIFDLLNDLRTRRGLAILIASHQMSFVPEYATHTLLVDRDDAIVCSGPTQEVLGSHTFQSRYGGVMDGNVLDVCGARVSHVH